MSCVLSPEKLRATKVAPSVSASSTGSIGGWTFASPRLDFDPMSADAENWPLVSPYTPLFSITYSMFTLRRMAWHNCPNPIESESPSPEMPMYVSARLAALAPVASAGIRPCTLLKPCDCFMKYAVVLDEQPMPLNFAARCGGRSSSQNAWTRAAVTESWPHPAHSVDIAPS